MGNGLAFGDHFPGFDLDQALGCFRLDPECKGHIDQQMSLPVMRLGHHIQWCDLLVHVRGDTTGHGQQAFAPEGGQGEDMYNGCQHGEPSLLKSTTIF